MMFDNSLNQITTKIGNTSFISSSLNYQTSNSSSQTISKTNDLTTNYFETSIDLLYSIADEIKEFQEINLMLKDAETTMSNYVVELNNEMPVINDNLLK